MKPGAVVITSFLLMLIIILLVFKDPGNQGFFLSVLLGVGIITAGIYANVMLKEKREMRDRTGVENSILRTGGNRAYIL